MCICSSLPAPKIGNSAAQRIQNVISAHPDLLLVGDFEKSVGGYFFCQVSESKKNLNAEENFLSEWTQIIVLVEKVFEFNLKLVLPKT